ncbi:uncharacterized protein ACNLHF_012801 isoform 2-T3 [Anomaloglossus baeobatrachus]|uniref:uncharacterized protein LOC142297136 isoform X2 n=1 Tax=Anomaloglossus baeobatrachus TaxID=238106 RepID=UPI003F4F79BC
MKEHWSQIPHISRTRRHVSSEGLFPASALPVQLRLPYRCGVIRIYWSTRFWSTCSLPQDHQVKNNIKSPSVKLGNCPEEYPKPDCELRYFPLCDNDYECPDSQKCCEEDCQQKCTYPIID